MLYEVVPERGRKRPATGVREPTYGGFGKNAQPSQQQACRNVDRQRIFPCMRIDVPTAAQPKDERREHTAEIRASDQIISKPFWMALDGIVDVPLARKCGDGERPNADKQRALAFGRCGPAGHNPNLNPNTGSCQTEAFHYDS